MKIIDDTTAKIDDIISKGRAKIEAGEAAIRVKVPDYTNTNGREVLAAWEYCREWLNTKLSEEDAIRLEKEVGLFSYISSMIARKCGGSVIH